MFLNTLYKISILNLYKGFYPTPYKSLDLKGFFSIYLSTYISGLFRVFRDTGYWAI